MELFKVSICNDFFQNEFGQNLDMAPKILFHNTVIQYQQNIVK